MPLTDTRIRNAKLPEKPYKLADGGGLYIEIKPNGSKLWRLRYRLAGKENVFAIGEYPAIGLAAARAERDAGKKIIRDGIHPSHHRKLERARRAHENANTFEAVAREWLAHNAEHWTAKTLRQRRHVLERDVFPDCRFPSSAAGYAGACAVHREASREARPGNGRAGEPGYRQHLPICHSDPAGGHRPNPSPTRFAQAQAG